MKHIIWGVLFAFCCSVVTASAQASRKPDIAASVTPTAKTSAASRERALKAYGTLPLSFEANEGQTADLVRFLARGDDYTLFLTPTGAVLTLPEVSPGANDPNVLSSTGKRDFLKMELQGAKPYAMVEGADELPGKSNYFIGNDPKKWHVGIPTFRRVEYNNPYPGIELAFYGNKRELEYDFIVAPEADANLIRLKIDGARSSEIDKNGNLLLRVGQKSVQFSAPNVYQDDGNKRQPVEGRWLVSGKGQFGFRLGAYDHHKALVIDPKITPAAAVPLAFSTYLGGSQTDVGSSVALDTNGDIYIAGHTNSSNFPPGQNQGAFPNYLGTNLSNNAFVAEMDPTGSTLIYSSYLGGNNGDTANGIAVDASGDAYVVGTTFSGNFPVLSAFQSACAGNCTDGDAFVTEFAPLGGSLIFSSFLGGTGFEQGNGIALNPQGLVYVVGWTSSADFPTAGNAHQTANGGGDDAFVAEIVPPETAGAGLLYSTYLGGSSTDVASAVAVDSSGKVYVVGYTISANFPTANPEQAACGGCANGFSSAFLTQFNTKGGINYSTFLGGTSYPNGNSADVPCGQTTGTGADQACGVAVDSSGNAYVAGVTTSTNFPTVNAYQSSCANGCSLSDAFVTQLNSTGSAITYSTYLGGSGDDRATAIAVDSVGNAFVTGQTSSTDFPLNQGFEVYATCSSCASGGHDAFVAEFDVPGNTLIYSSYLGGTTTQSGSGIAIGSADQAIVTGGTKSSSGFPIVAATDSQVFQSQFGGVEDAFLTEFPEGVSCSISTTGSNLTVNASLTCLGNFVAVNETEEEFLGFQWGDGSEETGSGNGCPAPCQAGAGSVTFPAQHMFPSAGTYSITPTAQDQSEATLVTTGFAVNVTLPYLSILTTTLPGGLVGEAYSQPLTASGGAGSYKWSMASGALPQGLTLSASGVISGSPTAATVSNFTVQASDGTETATQALSITVTVPPLTILTTSLAGGIVNVNYTQTLSASGGTGTYTWSITTGTLPAGLTLAASTGVIAGTPTTMGTSTFTVQVQDSTSTTVSKMLSIAVTNPPPQLSVLTTTLAGGTIGVAYPAATLQASGGTPPYTWSILSGTLPVGMSLNAQGIISGTPTTGGTFDFAVQVTDSTGMTATSSSFTPTLSIAIVAPAGAPACLPPTIGVGSNSNPLVVSASSNCSDSAGLASTTINWGDGSAALSGTSGSHTYASAGTYTITVTATDTNNLSATATGNVTVNAPVATAVPQGGSLPAQTSNVTAPLGVPSVAVKYTCTTANGPSGSQSTTAYGLTCTVTPLQVTLTGSPTAVQITVTTTGPSARLQPGLQRGGAGWLYAAILPMPGIALMGMGSYKRRRHLRRYAGLALLGLMVWGWVGCGVGTPTISGTQIPTPGGAYSVNAVGTDSSGNQQSIITVGFSVTGG